MIDAFNLASQCMERSALSGIGDLSGPVMQSGGGNNRIVDGGPDDKGERPERRKGVQVGQVLFLLWAVVILGLGLLAGAML